MSENIRWHRRTLRSGKILERVVCTTWTARLGPFWLAVTNYPGTPSLDWEITKSGTDWRMGAEESRFDYSVGRLKAKVAEIARVMAEKIP